MYTTRIRVSNYGPIDQLDINFPYSDDTPKPVVLVGQNGSGKSILLSHIVNGLLIAKDITYPETTEVETGKVYKYRSGTYIKSGSEFYFARVDFEKDLFTEEMRLQRPRQEYSSIPNGLHKGDAIDAWNNIRPQETDYFTSFFSSGHDETIRSTIKGIVSSNCLLYFPPNRFEEPAWLNRENLRSKAQYMDLKHLTGHTNRRLINYSPLQDNRDWLFDLIYDRSAFELQTRIIAFNKSVSLPVFVGHSGNATNIYDIALRIVRKVVNRSQGVRFGVGKRINRVVSIVENEKRLVPNIFQLSSGETSLLNLFLSILRDFDLSEVSLTNSDSIRGVVVVDEIDLHLHTIHQHTILPELIQMFPNVQFIITSHSPLLVLGLKNTLGRDGFALYQMPQGKPIAPEEFSEFSNAYNTVKRTNAFLGDIRKAVEATREPILFVEGTTDKKYLLAAAEHLGCQSVLNTIEIRDGNGEPGLKTIWNRMPEQILDLMPHTIVLLHDCDYTGENANKGNMFRRIIPRQWNHPLEKGIENLFSKDTLERARRHKSEFLNVRSAHTQTTRGICTKIPEKWSIDNNEKTNLCNWLCDNGTREDFQHFTEVFDLVDVILESNSSQ